MLKFCSFTLVPCCCSVTVLSSGPNVCAVSNKVAILVAPSKVSVSCVMVWILLVVGRPLINWVKRSLSDLPNFVPCSNTLLANCWVVSWDICLRDKSGPKGLNLKRKAENIFSIFVLVGMSSCWNHILAVPCKHM